MQLFALKEMATTLKERREGKVIRVESMFKQLAIEKESLPA